MKRMYFRNEKSEEVEEVEQENNIIKVYEMLNTSTGSKWYELYDRKDDYQNNIFNNGFEKVKLPDGYKLNESEFSKLYIYKNGFAYAIHKDETGYMLYPAILSMHEAYEQKRIIYI